MLNQYFEYIFPEKISGSSTKMADNVYISHYILK